MKNRFAFLFLLLPLVIIHTQESPRGGDDQDEASRKEFPAEYVGVWKGDLEIFNAGGKVQTVPMELHILPIDDTTYTYTIIYGEDKEAGKRDYLLRAGNRGDHHWVIDEQDGILLDNFYVGGVLHGPFTVMGSRLYSSLEARDNCLIYTISSGRAEPFRESGTTVEQDGKSQDIEVASFGVSNFQRAWLRQAK